MRTLNIEHFERQKSSKPVQIYYALEQIITRDDIKFEVISFNDVNSFQNYFYLSYSGKLPCIRKKPLEIYKSKLEIFYDSNY